MACFWSETRSRVANAPDKVKATFSSVTFVQRTKFSKHLTQLMWVPNNLNLSQPTK